MVFMADGFISVDPALGLRERAEAFLRSRQWSTASILYGDQPEADDSQTRPGWSVTFGLGLDHVPKSAGDSFGMRQSNALRSGDHVPKTTGDWFGDVAAIVEFLEPVAREARCEFILEFRLSSRLWYSETLGHIGDEPGDKVDLVVVRKMLEQFTRQRRSWWQKLMGR